MRSGASKAVFGLVVGAVGRFGYHISSNRSFHLDDKQSCLQVWKPPGPQPAAVSPPTLSASTALFEEDVQPPPEECVETAKRRENCGGLTMWVTDEAITVASE